VRNICSGFKKCHVFVRILFRLPKGLQVLLRKQQTFFCNIYPALSHRCWLNRYTVGWREDEATRTKYRWKRINPLFDL